MRNIGTAQIQIPVIALIFQDFPLRASPNELERDFLVPAPLTGILTWKDSHMSSIAKLTVSVTAQPRSAIWTKKILPALVAISLGCVLIFVMGFAETSTLHNAAHDGRHAAGFPCH